jgi:hypothetical protein
VRATCRECGADGEIGRSIVHATSCSMFVVPGAAFAVPVVPTCPESCCWRTTCSTATQEGILTLWAEGRITKPEECVFFGRRAKVHRETTGLEAPGSSQELLAQLSTLHTGRDA